MRKLLLSFFLFISFFAISLIPSTPASAAVTGFEPGKIIDDSVMANNNSMSVGAIQAFLNSKVATCDTWGTQPYAGTTRAQYAASRGVSTPFTCLKDYSENGKASAQIIYDVSQKYSINPQVLIVLLQKEQGLVTDDWPWQIQYRSATGYGCPDTAPCDAQYYGLTNQLDWAAKMFRAILNNSSTWYTPYVLGDNYIQYSPDASCGGSVVTIQNRATQALYNYTPYQPNAGAIAADWGTAPCGAYGNRNFYLYFTEWFGSVRGLLFDALAYRQSPYTQLKAGESKKIYIDYKNMGSWEWRDDTSTWPGLPPIHLAATNPINRSSIFSYGWPTSSRPNLTFSKVFKSDGITLAEDQHVVKTGQIARYEFNITAPWNTLPGVYREHFQPVLEGADGWNINGLSWIDITVEPTYRSDFVSQCNKPAITQNSTVDCYIRYKNSGNTEWYDDLSVPNGKNPIHLAASGPINRSSVFSANWPSSGRSNVLFSKIYEQDNTTLSTDQHTVKIGQIAEFSFTLTARDNLPEGNYREYFQPVAENAAGWAMGGVAWIDISVSNRIMKASFINQSAYPTVQRGSAAPVFFSFKNTGNVAWYDTTSAPAKISPVHLAATNPINRTSVFSYSWPSGGRPTFNFSKVYESDGITLSADQHRANPGQIARFDFNLTPPWTLNPGIHREYFQLVSENSANWMVTGSTGWMDASVTP